MQFPYDRGLPQLAVTGSNTTECGFVGDYPKLAWYTDGESNTAWSSGGFNSNILGSRANECTRISRNASTRS